MVKPVIHWYIPYSKVHTGDKNTGNTIWASGVVKHCYEVIVQLWSLAVLNPHSMYLQQFFLDSIAVVTPSQDDLLGLSHFWTSHYKETDTGIYFWEPTTPGSRLLWVWFLHLSQWHNGQSTSSAISPFSVPSNSHFVHLVSHSVAWMTLYPILVSC